MEELAKLRLSWKRPPNMPWPKTWHRFEATSKDGTVYKIKIQDVPPNRFDDVVDFMALEYSKREPIASHPKFAKLSQDETIQAALKIVRRKVLEQKLSLFAVLDNDDPTPEIMGVQLHYVQLDGDPPLKIPSEEYQKLSAIDAKLREDIDIRKIFGSERYIRDYGLVVAPQFYGLGISYQFYYALAKLAQTFLLPGAMMCFTSFYAQKSAEKAGFQTLNEIKYEDFKDADGNVIFPIEVSESLKCMYIKYT